MLSKEGLDVNAIGIDLGGGDGVGDRGDAVVVMTKIILHYMKVCLGVQPAVRPRRERSPGRSRSGLGLTRGVISRTINRSLNRSLYRVVYRGSRYENRRRQYIGWVILSSFVDRMTKGWVILSSFVDRMTKGWVTMT